MSTRLAVAVILMSCGACLAADANNDIGFQETRSLGKLAIKLGELYGYLVTYEEAPYDEASETFAEVYANGKHFLYPAWKPITFHLPPDSPTWSGLSVRGVPLRTAANPLQMVQSLVDQYNASGNPGRFAAIADPGGEYIHVIPAGRTVQGKTEYFQPIFDTRVSPSPGPGRCATVLLDLLHEVGRLRNTNLVLGPGPTNALMNYQCQITGTNLTARKALKQILRQMGVATQNDSQRMTWAVCYESNVDSYFVSFTQVLQGFREPETTATHSPRAGKAPENASTGANAPAAPLPKATASPQPLPASGAQAHNPLAGSMVVAPQ